MNLFILDRDPELAAQFHCNRHVVKMILETAQLLSTAHHVLDGDQAEKIGRIYKKTHENHPCAVWVRESPDNYSWAHMLGMSLCAEYTHRYGKVHKTQDVLWNLAAIPHNIPDVLFTEFPQCMPEEYKNQDTVAAYRNYYIGEKMPLLVDGYKNRDVPIWLKLRADRLAKSV